MNLIRDVLDNQVVDRDGANLGKVDGIVVELRDSGPPRLVRMEIGAIPMAHRISPRLGDWLAARWSRLPAERGQACGIPWSDIADVGINVRLRCAAADTSALAWEDWLRDHVVARIPGNR